MEQIASNIPSWLITAFMGGIGIAVGWGILKAEVKNIKEELKTQKDQLTHYMKKQECSQIETVITDDLDEIKGSIEENRRVMTKQFEEIREWMGYVKRVVEDFDKK